MSDVPPPLTPSQPPYQAPAQPAPQPKSGGGKCAGLGCGLGCLIAVVACVVLMVALFIGGKKYVSGLIEDYTASQAVPVEAPQASPEAIASAKSEFDAFQAGLQQGGNPVPLALTAEEINLILFNHPQFAQMAGMARVDIVDDKLRSQVSIDFDTLPIPEGFFKKALGGKFFNGEVGLSIGMVAGRPAIYVEDLSVNGAPVPAPFMEGFRSQNLLEEMKKNNPSSTTFFDKLEDMRIENGELILVPKGAANP